MKPTPFRRYYTGVAALLVLGFLGTVLANTAPAPPGVAGPPTPRFFTWQGAPFTDGLNHYLITVSPTAGSGWLQLDGDDYLVASDSPQDSVDPDHIDAVVGIGAPPTQIITDTVAALTDHPGIDQVESLGFDMFAVAGSISSSDLAALAGVSSVAVDPALTTATVDPYFPTQWGLDNDGTSTDPWAVAADADVDAPEGWHRTRGRGVVVAVIDSGVDVNHPDLADNIWHNSDEQCGNGVDDDGNGYVDDCTGWDFANGVATVTDHMGHGTHVAGIIAAEANNGIGVAGLAYEAQIMPLKIGDTAPALSTAIQAIGDAIDNGANIINASWGVSDPSAAAYLETAIAAAADAGVLFVTAAGNQPVNIDVTPTYPASLPLDNIVTVGASTAVDTPASWSSYGAESVDIFAPGEYIISTVPGGYDIYSGTSMATPMVAAAAALLWSATPDSSYAEVKAALLDRSDGPSDSVTAFRGLSVSEGRLNVDRAMYSAPLFQPPVMYEFRDFNSFTPQQRHEVTITAKTVDPFRAHPQTPTTYRAGLYAPYQGQPMAVVGQAIDYVTDTAVLTATTDETGRALIGNVFDPEDRPGLVQDGDLTQLWLELPAGTYAFVMEMVDVADPSEPRIMGDPSAVFFIVSDDGSVAEMPQIPIGGSPYPTTTTTATPVTAAPSTTTQPSTTATTEEPPTTLPQPSTTVTVTTTGPPPVTEPPSTSVPTTTVPLPTTIAPPPPTTTPGPATTAPSASPTTSPPVPATTAAPAPTTTTTTSAVPGTAPIPTTTTTAPAPTTTTTIAPGQTVIRSVNPDEGPTGGNMLVTISGSNLPGSPVVYLGERRAEVVAVIEPVFIVIDTPPGDPGKVDVRVVDSVSGAETILIGAFTYVDSGSTSPPTTSPQTTTRPPAVTTTIAAPSTTTSLPGLITTTPPPTVATTPSTPMPSLEDWRDSLLQTPDGLTLAPVPSNSPIAQIPLDVWVGELCRQRVCPGWVLES